MIGTQAYLIEQIREHLGLKTYVQLAKILGVDAAKIGNLRAGRVTIKKTMLLRLHKASNIDIEELRKMGGLA